MDAKSEKLLKDRLHPKNFEFSSKNKLARKA
jgi:hypothetical protein